MSAPKRCPRCLRGQLLADGFGLCCLACGHAEPAVMEATLESARIEEDDEPLPLVNATELR